MVRKDEVVPIPPAIVESLHEQRGRMSATALRRGEERLVARLRAARSPRLRRAFAVAAALALVGTGVAVFEHRAGG
jgi:hypothetical protein